VLLIQCFSCTAFSTPAFLPSFFIPFLPQSHSTFGIRNNTRVTQGKFNLNEAASQRAHYAYAALYGGKWECGIAVASQQLLAAVTPHNQLAGILAKHKRIIITILCSVGVAPLEILMTKCHINSRNGFPRYDRGEKCWSRERIRYLSALQ